MLLLTLSFMDLLRVLQPYTQDSTKRDLAPTLVGLSLNNLILSAPYQQLLHTPASILFLVEDIILTVLSQS